jgi:hypothetical protein
MGGIFFGLNAFVLHNEYKMINHKMDNMEMNICYKTYHFYVLN